MWQFYPILHLLMRRKFSALLLVVQIALATAIFSNLAYMVQQIKISINQPSGIADEQLFAVTLRPLTTLISYSDALRDIAALQALPDIESVAAMRWEPFGGLSSAHTLRSSANKDAAKVAVATADISPQGLSTLGLELVAGRDFTDDDVVVKTSELDAEPQVIIITRVLADTLFGKEQTAVGKLVYDGNLSRRVIGVTEDWLGYTLPFYDRVEKTVFYPRYDAADREHRYLVRTKTSQQRTQVIAATNILLMDYYKNELLSWVEKIDDLKNKYRNKNLMVINLGVVLLVALGVVVALAIGGQTLFWVNQQIKQIGIRRALGANRQVIIMQFLIENSMVCCMGLLLGVVLSLQVNQLVIESVNLAAMPASFLFSTCLVIFWLCLASAAIPAWRAAQIPPSVAARSV